MPETKFHVFRLKPFILEALQDIGFHEPTEIQKKLIPVALKRKSVIGQSQTGTGKTHSYLLPILHLIDPSEEKVQAVILAPTRELAGQIHEEILKITKFCPPGEEIRSRLFTGGMDKKRDMEKLKRQPHIVVGTPGRINDWQKSRLFLFILPIFWLSMKLIWPLKWDLSLMSIKWPPECRKNCKCLFFQRLFRKS